MNDTSKNKRILIFTEGLKEKPKWIFNERIVKKTRPSLY